MQSGFVDKAIPMVQVNQHSGKYVLTNEAISFFKAIKGPIAVVSVAGLYRTGKSYLLNRVLLSRSNGFGVGPTVNPCTKGLWCWGSPIKGMSAEGEPVNIIVIDTEGIGALDEDQTHDTKIFTLAILASSCFIYNSVGSIDENAIQNLSLVVNLTKHIQLKSSGMDEDGVDPDEVSNYFPSFYWVVRDFSLQLQDMEGKAISSREYLEKALAPQAGYTDDVEEKNRIRRLLTAFFKDRDCFTMIRPLVDEQKLQNLDKMSYDDLRPEFVHQVMNFRKKVTESVKIKTLQNQRLNGEMYCTMISSYVNAINEGAVPNIENAWNYMCEEQCQKALDECYEIFIREMKEGFREFPKPEDDFNKCVMEAEEKAIQMFKERALGDGSAQILRQLKKRIKQQIDEARAQNIKQSNQDIRNYILKQINPIKMKLNGHQYRGYPDFEKEVTALFERAMTEGPQLHGYKLIYTEAFKKFSSQGAQFLFRDFIKQQEKQKERTKDTEAKLKASLQEATEQIEKLQNQKRQLDASSYQTIHQLENKVDTLKTQLQLMTRDKEEEEKKMQRQFMMKMQSQQSEKKDKEARINDYMEKLESMTRKFNEAQKGWEKDRAVFELKCQQQQKDLEEFGKKEKKWEAEQQLQVNEMSSKNKDMAQRYERERQQLKSKLKDMEEKYNSTQEELSTLKEELEEKISKWEKKEKKLKDDLANIRKEHQNMKSLHEQEKMNLKEEIDSVRNESSKGSNTLQTYLKEAERTNKELQDKFKKERNTLETENEKLEQALKHMKQANEKLQEKNQFLVYEQERQRSDLEKQLCERGQEAIAQKLEQITQRHNIDMEALRERYENEKKELEMNINNLLNSNKQFEDQVRFLKLEETKMRVEHQNTMELLQLQLDNQKESNKTLESEKEREKWKIQNELRNAISQLESQIEDVKDRAEKERNQISRAANEEVTQMKNFYELEKETNMDRQKKEVSKLKKKYENEIEQLNRQYQEERQTLQDENQDLLEKLMNNEQLLKNQSSAMQHEIDMKEKKVEELSKTLAEIKNQFENKEKEFKKREDEMTTAFKVEKEKLETRVDKLTSEHHVLQKELMAVRQTNQQQKSNLDKRENRILELESAITVQKQQLSEQIDKLHLKVTDMEKEYHEKTTSYEKENALLHQKNDFKDNKISDLEKIIHNASKDFEERLSKYKEQKEFQTNEVLQKLREEKNVVDAKYQKLKSDTKEREENMKKSLIELSSLKETQQLRISTLQNKCLQLEEKKVNEITVLQSELSNYKNSYTTLKSEYETQRRQSQSRIEKLESELSDSSLKYQKERSLLEQKLEFQDKSKNDTIEDLQQRINRLQTLNGQLMETKNSEKSKAERNYYENMRMTESKFAQKITELTESLRREQNDKDLKLRDRDQEIKELKQKYQTQKMQKESSLKTSEKKLSEMSENEKKLREENERLRTDKERRDLEYVRKESQIKDKNKEKINDLEVKVKHLETEKNSSFISLEKERVKWNMEKEQIKDHVSELEERLKKAERDKDKYKSDVERLKAERKNNNRTHSYISSLKTTYEPHKVQQIQETNKENSHHQN